MILFHILWPVFAMVALIFTVWTVLVTQRLRHLKTVRPTAADFVDRAAMHRYFGPAAPAADNLANLFEMPVLFFAIVPLLMATQQAGIAQVLLAWIYVALRAVHSWHHLRGRIRPRFRMYVASVAVLAAMWIGFLIDFVAAAFAYSAALSRLLQP
jgi:hypothetical protein